jgi:glycosyltransferase involved in cell wall biosynthesis
MRILLVSGYHGGSHQAWAEGYQRYSAHEVRLLTLPARFWKWRMHGGAVTLARRFLEQLESGRLARPDLLLFTDMVDLTTFLALIRRSLLQVPAVLYMHENQLTYPLPTTSETGPMRRQKGERDLHYAFVNFASMLAADKVYFNSDYHRRDVLTALPGYLRHFPEFNELGSAATLAPKCGVLAPGIDGAQLDQHRSKVQTSQAPLIIWNQRWEFDKAPRLFFDALEELERRGLDFRLAVCGQHFVSEPPEFASARAGPLKERIIHWGYAPRGQYARLLWRSSMTASTALHEFFGISILEAMYCQTYAALPHRLSYPELLPVELHEDSIYETPEQLVDKLAWAIECPGPARQLGRRLARAAAAYDWRSIAPIYDAEFEGLL